jgi:hypothetical protein
MTNREQEFVVQRAWNRILTDNTPLLETILSVLTKNPLPTEPRFRDVFPGKNIAAFDDRWPWVINYMLPPWGAMTESDRSALVDDPLVNAAAPYSLLTPLIPIIP